MWYAKSAKSNENVSDLTPSNRAVVSGGTQGIGGGIALRYALAGASVWIIGRSAQRGESMVEKLRAASQEGERRRQQQQQQQQRQQQTSSSSSSQSPSASSERPDHAFLQADLSDVADIKRVAGEVQKRARSGGIDWLIECQGGPPTGNAGDTPAGIDSHFAVQCLSRYGLAKQLLASGTIRKGVCFVAAPSNGSKTPLDLDDIEAKAKRSRFGLNMLATGMRDSSVLDAAAQTFAERHPNLVFSHLFPGIVATSAAANQGLPFPIPQIASLGSYVLPSPQQYGEIPFYLHANPEGVRYLRSGEANLFGPTLRRSAISPNVADKGAREAVVSKLDSYGV